MENNKTNMIEMPDSVREALKNREAISVPVRDLGDVAASRVVVHDRSGRYGIAPIPVERPAGIPVENVGFDTVTRQARTYGDTVGRVEHPTEIDHEEV